MQVKQDLKEVMIEKVGIMMEKPHLNYLQTQGNKTEAIAFVFLSVLQIR